MLSVRDLTVDYGPVRAVRGISFDVAQGEVVALLGANGAGKTTTLMAIAGLRRIASGAVRFEEQSLVGVAPEDIVRRGVGVSPEGRRIFAGLTVAENLRLAGSVVPREDLEARREALLDRFGILRERFRQRAGLLSGGEQQMLALARALLPRPRLLMLDEPSLGLAPQVVEQVFDIIAALKTEGTTVLLVEQNVARSLEVADRAVVLAGGRVALSGDAADLDDTTKIHAAYFAA